MDADDLLAACEGFDWDEGNTGKNWAGHRVSDGESEQVFFSQPVAIRTDREHSSTERRFAALGRSDSGRLLFVSFTLRGANIRIISARDMTAREVAAYAKVTKADS